MRFIWRLLIITAGLVIAFFLIIILVYSMALRPRKTQYDSRVVQINATQVLPGDIDYPAGETRPAVAGSPLVIRVSLDFKDSLISSSGEGYGKHLLPVASAAVDPAFISVYNYPVAIKALSVFLATLSDTTDITPDFRLFSPKGTTRDMAETMNCNDKKAGEWIMNRISDSRNRWQDFMIIRYNGSNEPGSKLFVRILLEKGELLSPGIVTR
jgi:hypothetical protein